MERVAQVGGHVIVAGVREGSGHFPFPWGPHHLLKARTTGFFLFILSCCHFNAEKESF